MYRTKLTSNMKAKLYPGLVHRDGDVCFYDEMPFVQEVEGLQRNENIFSLALHKVPYFFKLSLAGVYVDEIQTYFK